MNWLLFVLLAAVIVVAGSKLSFYADILALKLRISSSAIGALLVSAITSLPELTTTLGSVVTVRAPDMALGNVFGSNMFNLSIIALCEILFLKQGVFQHIHRRQISSLGASFGVLAVCMIGLLIPLNIALLGLKFGLGSVFVVLAYLFFFRWMHKTGQLEEMIEEEEAEEAGEVSLSTAILAFTICSVLIIASGVSLAVIGDRLVESTGMTHSFMGVLFLATATSLPELSVGISAVRRKSYDLIVGTVVGSNIFNIMVVALADFFHTDSALNIPANLGLSHLLTAGGVAFASILLALAIYCKPKMALTRALYAFAIIGVYVVCLLAIYKGWL